MLLLALTGTAESNEASDACGAGDVMCLAPGPGPLIGCLHGVGALCTLPAPADVAFRLADAVLVSRPCRHGAPKTSAVGAADVEGRPAFLSTWPD